MSKAVTKESLVAKKNYITPSGLQRLKDERRFLLTRERRAVTQVVAWAASNGDRSENADYQYGKRRLREIDRRIRFLTKRIDAAEVVDPEAPRGGRAATQVFFGATVRYANAAGTERVVSVVGLDEVDLDRNYISWMSPLARALMKSGPGDRVVLHAPGTTEQLRDPRGALRAHSRGTLQRTTGGRGRAKDSALMTRRVSKAHARCRMLNAHETSGRGGVVRAVVPGGTRCRERPGESGAGRRRRRGRHPRSGQGRHDDRADPGRVQRPGRSDWPDGRHAGVFGTGRAPASTGWTPQTNQVSVLVAESNESHGVTQDSKGRLISAQAWDGSTRIGVIYPPGSEAVLADSFEGKPFSRPNDVIVARDGGVYFTDPGSPCNRPRNW